MNQGMHGESNNEGDESFFEDTAEMSEEEIRSISDYEENLQNDPEYQSHLQSIHDDYHEVQRTRYTAPFFLFLDEIYNIRLLVAFVNYHASDLTNKLDEELQQLSKEIDKASEFDRHILNSKGYELQERQRQLDFSAIGMKKSQYSMAYANAVNILENYMLEMAKLLIQADPKRFATNLSSNFELKELTNLISNKDEMWDYIFRKFLRYDDKQSSLDGILKLTEHAGINQTDKIILMALKRAQSVRHKLTHRHGRIDEMFLDKRRSLQPTKDNLDKSLDEKYRLVGNANITESQYYEITLLELNKVLDLTEDVAMHFEQQIEILFPSVQKFNAMDLLHEFDHAHAMLSEWEDKTNP